MPITATSRHHAPLGCLLAGLAIATMAARSEAQAPRGFFTEPILILAGGGHTAPVRSLIFTTPDGSQLLSGGMDKQIHAWNLDADRSHPARTLRPPLGRASRGHVYAMALSPGPDARGQRLLAVAGHGVLGPTGEILLFRYPGLTPQGTGEIEAQLPVPAPDGTVGPGHTNVVNALAFSPDGRYLASASNDGSARIWEVATRRHVAALVARPGAVNAPVDVVAFTPDGLRVVSGGSDGVLRLWDVANVEAPRLLQEAPPEPQAMAIDPIAPMIISLAVSPDGRWIVVGRESGHLVRFDAATLANRAFLPDARGTGGTSGPMEALAISPDGTLLASAAVAANLANPADRPTVDSVVMIRSMPDGRVVRRLAGTSNLVKALAFSPDGRRFAFSGGDEQGVYVQDLGDPAAVADEVRGNGSSIWDVGFREDGRAIRFARQRPARPGAAAEYEGFDLRERHFADAGGAAGYRHAMAVDQGWTIAPTGQYSLQAGNGQGPPTTLTLDQAADQRWWAYTVIPPGPGRPAPLAAVACGTGVAIFTLPGGVRTRHLYGHGGPVYSLAASPDGRWLVTGSADQTVRLWSLAGADRPAPYGARFEKNPAGAWAVAAIAPGGFADGIGLKAGDVIEEFYVGAARADADAFLPALDREPPTRMFNFFARRPGEPDLIKAGATKRDSPALTLFPGLDRQWVLWTPQGYYDTSAAGDRDSIGWLSNRGSVARLLAGAYDTIDKFEAKYRQRKAVQPNVIDRLLDTADPQAALTALVPAAPPDPAAPAPAAPADPTTSRVPVLALQPVEAAPIDRPVPVTRPTLGLRYDVLAAQGAAKIKALWIEVNGRRLDNLVVGPPVQGLQGRREVPIDDSLAGRVSLVAVDERGVERAQTLDIVNRRPPEPTRRPARLEIIAIGADRFADPRLPEIPHAGRDARDLARFLGQHLVDPTTNARFRAEQVHARTFVGAEVATAPILAALDALRYGEGKRDGGAEGPPAPGDVVAVVIESHYLEVRSKALLASAEPGVKDDPAPPSLSAGELAARLGDLAQLGCRVVVLLDAVHEVKAPGWDSGIGDWVRRLQSDSKVVAFVASDHGPSSAAGDGHRAFAQGVLDVLKAKSAGRLRKPSDVMALFDAQRTVIDSVLALTGRKQHAQCYIPDSLPPQAPFFDPGLPR